MNINFRKKQIWKACRIAGMYPWQCDEVVRVQGNAAKAFPELVYWAAFSGGRTIKEPMEKPSWMF